MLHQVKAPQFYTGLGLQRVLNPPVYGNIQDFSRPLNVFQVLFKKVCTFQANPVLHCSWHGRIASGEQGSGSTPLENHKLLFVSLEIVVQTPLKKQLDPSGPSASGGKSV